MTEPTRESAIRAAGAVLARAAARIALEDAQAAELREQEPS